MPPRRVQTIFHLTLHFPAETKPKGREKGFSHVMKHARGMLRGVGLYTAWGENRLKSTPLAYAVMLFPYHGRIYP
jgi:hypothetical protein